MSTGKFPEPLLNSAIAYNTVINDHWENILPQLPDQSIDLVLTDPPYNISQQNISIPNKISLGGNAFKLEYGDWDHTFDPSATAHEYQRLLKDNGQAYIFTSNLLLPQWIDLMAPHFSWRLLTLVKPDPLFMIRQRHWVSATEYILWCFRGKYTFNFLGHKHMYNYQMVSTSTEKGRIHPNQKPINLLRKYIEVSSRPNDLILDNFCGSASTGVAAWHTNRRCLLIEADEGHARRAQKRLEGIQTQRPLLDAALFNQR